jgi:hypothetical protein
MHYYVRPSFDPQRADEIIGPLSLDEINSRLMGGHLSPRWLVTGISDETTYTPEESPENEWFPLAQLPGVIAYRASPPVTSNEIRGCLDGLVTVFLVFLGVAGILLAIFYAACSGVSLK